jgi:hypothetical protein
MMKSLPLFAMLALLATAAIVGLPFAPQVKAHEVVALAKADQLPSRAILHDCKQQIWPNYDSSCLRSFVDRTAIQDARLVITHR